MDAMKLNGKKVLVTGAAIRVGRALALAAAQAGADIILHFNRSDQAAQGVRSEIQALGRVAHLLQANLAEPNEVEALISRAQEYGPLYALVNNAAIFGSQHWKETSLEIWNRHLAINLTAPFILSRDFARALEPGQSGRIVNILDWRALRPGADHLAYAISKAGLAALTRSLAQALAPQITVNAMALGAILPPTVEGEAQTEENEVQQAEIIQPVPAGRWAKLDEVQQTLLFLLTGPTYITGEVIHIDGGRHLV
jgi:NAD(P)-dependent dehydrogenase (short-subunit alcohol dehydrogenase family)